MVKEDEKKYQELEDKLKQKNISLKQKMSLHKERIKLLKEMDFQEDSEYAEIIENPYPWDKGAPLPHVFSDSVKTFLIYTLPRNFTHDSITIINGTESPYNCALVCFDHLIDYRFGGLNDEVLEYSTLSGIELYELHLVRNSAWLGNLQKTNAHHFCYNPDYWTNFNHYYFAFHDETFECIAKGYTVDLYHGSIKEVAAIAFDRLFN